MRCRAFVYVINEPIVYFFILIAIFRWCIAGINDLATLEPLLAKQWSKKNKIKPTEVSIGSHKKVIWRCEKGHEWEVTDEWSDKNEKKSIA